MSFLSSLEINSNSIKGHTHTHAHTDKTETQIITSSLLFHSADTELHELGNCINVYLFVHAVIHSLPL